MKTKIILLAMTAVATFTACNSDGNDEPTAQDSRTPIMLSANAEAQNMTRAGQGLQNTQFKKGKDIDVQIYATNINYDMLTYFTADNAGTLQPRKGVFPYYPTDQSSIRIVGIYPSGYMKASEFSVQKISQASDDAYMKSDLMFADTSGVEPSANVVPLKFKHKMTKIQVNLSKEGGVKLANSVVTLKGVKVTTAFNPQTGAVTIDGATGNGEDIIMTTNGSDPSAAIIVPQVKSSGILLEISLQNNDVLHYKTVQDITFQSGKVYTFNVKVIESNLTVTTTVAPWDTDSDGNGTTDANDDVEERLKLASN